MEVVTTLPILSRTDSATAHPLVEMASSEKTAGPLIKYHENRLDITVLGLESGTALAGIRCVLLRYRQNSRLEPLRMSMVKV